MTRLRSFRIPDLYGGVNKELSAHIIPPNTATKTDNWVLRSKGLEKAKGWETFTSQILTDGVGTVAGGPTECVVLKIDEYYQDDGSSYLVCFTNKRAYWFDEDNTDLWLPLTEGASTTETTLNGAHNTPLGSPYQLTVADSTDFLAGEAIIIGLGTATAEYAIIDSIPDGTHINLTEEITGNHADTDPVHDVSTMVFGTDISHVDSENSFDKFYFTDGVNAVQVWDATGTPTFSSNLGGLESGDDVEGIGTTSADVKAKTVRSFEGFLVLGYMVEEGTTVPQKVRWSQYGDFTKWVNESDGTGQAGYFTFDGPDFIQSFQQLKRELIIYRERSIEAMSYIGPPDVFAFRRAETGTGLLAPEALVDLGDRHIFAGPDDFYSYNGISLQSLGDGAITKDFFDKLDPSQKSGVKAFFVEEESEVWFCYSTTGNAVKDKAYVYSIPFNKWSGPRDMDATGFGYYDRQSNITWDTAPGAWDDYTNTWDSRRFLSNNPINLMGNDDGLVFVVDEVNDANGSAILARYESKVLDCGGPSIKKRLQRVRIGMREDTSSTISVYVGTKDFLGETVTWNGPYTLSVDDGDEPYVYMDLTARYFQIRVDTSDPANMKDIELFFIPRVHR